jgi:hypothetical protein
LPSTRIGKKQGDGMSMEQEAYGRHIIKSWPRGHLWQARAFIGERQIGEPVIEGDRPTAIAELKTRLDKREEELKTGKGADGSPSAIEYAEAFARLGKLPASYDAMLLAHRNAPKHTLTATQLAEAAGYSGWNGANLHYGKLGQMLAEELGYTPPTRPNGSVIYTAAIATWDKDRNPDPDNPHFEWIMRPQVVEALGNTR